MTVSTNPAFNPSGNEDVAKVKEMTEAILTYLQQTAPNNRQRSIALTNYEQAAMWAVKSYFS